MNSRGDAKGRTRTRSIATILAAVSLLGGLSAPTQAYPRPGEILERVSVASGGRQAEGDPMSPGDYWMRQVTISANGRFVAFASSSHDLVAGGSSVLDPIAGEADILNVFVHDRKTTKTELVSGTLKGDLPQLPPLGPTGSFRPMISANGRYVAFISDVSNLVEFDLNNADDVFVYDRKRDELERVSVASDGSETGPLADSGPGVSISGSGRYVVFESTAGNLTDKPISGCTLDAAGVRQGPCNKNIYIHDRRDGSTSLISSGLDGDAADGHSTAPAINRSGRFVVFDSSAGNLTTNDDNICPWPPRLDSGVSCGDVFLFDRRTKKTELISVAIDGTSGASNHATSGAAAGYGWLGDPLRISANGRFVYFQGFSSELVPNDPNGDDAFVRDRKLDRTYRVSVTSAGEDVYTGSSLGMDASGRHFHVGAILMNDQETRLPTDEGCIGCEGGSYVYDLMTGALEPVVTGGDWRDLQAEGKWPPAPELRPSYSGRELIFWSKDPLVPDDTNERFDVFVHDRGNPLGTGGLGGPPPKGHGPPPDDRICITGDVCIPPGAAVSAHDATDDLGGALTEQGANLYGASLTYRPQNGDLFAAIDLEHMPWVTPLVSPIFYGLRFKVESKSYEVRASSLLGGSFGLFQCAATTTSSCMKVAGLHGGYGTTGERVVFSLPLDEIGLTHGGKLRKVTAFSGLGSYVTGASKVLDAVRLR